MHFTRDYIVERLKTYRPAAGRSDFDLNPGLERLAAQEAAACRAAVLVPILERREGFSVLLTLRADHLARHAGQVAFPGGRMDPEDPHPVHTALREAREEIGLPPEKAEVIGRLASYRTGTGYLITPVVALLNPDLELTPEPGEVAAIFEAPLDFLMNPANRQRHRRPWRGADRLFYAMPYKDYYIWGATAAMLVNLADVLWDGGQAAAG